MGPRLLTLDETTLRRRTSIKWRQYAPDVLPLWIAEMDVMSSPAVVEELSRIARDGDTGYPVNAAYMEAVAAFYAEHGAAVDPALTRPVADVMTGMRAAMCALTRPGDPVYITVPVYPPFHATVLESQRRLVTVPLGPTGRLDPAALDEAMEREGRGALLLANPHNPTGTVPTPDELRAVAQVADRHGVGVVCDEVHAPLVLPGATWTPALALPETQSWLAVFSAAKGWNLPGVKAAGIVGGSAAGDVVAALPDGLPYGTSHLAVRLHTVALEQDRDWLADLIADLDANRALLGRLLAERLPAATWRPVEATYLAWLDLRALDLGPDPARHLATTAKVALMSGLPFGAGEGHARLNFATSPELLTEAVDRVAAATG
ncbi:MalY/PatB family protein [Janibacter hoylei]|uniref:MalY/PatB family protein n=1 Tax=Janibacter hoylei TaxID=364298 RepID=UPI0024917451|nr:aminotransferase class I/II-fold pyridoxal phosphate-dependent enzyme [Janibacter hoylei]